MPRQPLRIPQRPPQDRQGPNRHDRHPERRDRRPFRRSQQKTCAALVAALCQAAQASSFAIAGQLSALTEVQFGSALTRLYRFLRNERFDNWLLTERLLGLLGAEQKHLLLALD